MGGVRDADGKNDSALGSIWKMRWWGVRWRVPVVGCTLCRIVTFSTLKSSGIAMLAQFASVFLGRSDDRRGTFFSDPDALHFD